MADHSGADPRANTTDEARIRELSEFAREIDADLHRTFPFVVEEVRASGDKNAAFVVRGTAAVFDKWSLDLGGFRERIRPGAFDAVLRDDPHVLHVWDHNTRYVFASTRNKTLELTADEDALHYYSKVAKTSYAEDLRVLLERGDIDQSSFAFTVPQDGSGEEWSIAADGVVEREITQIANLYDVTTCAMGAYPQTEAALALRNKAQGRRDSGATVVAPYVAFTSSGSASAEPVTLVWDTRAGGGQEVAPNTAGKPQTSASDVADKADIDRLKRDAEAAVSHARERLHRGKET